MVSRTLVLLPGWLRRISIKQRLSTVLGALNRLLRSPTSHRFIMKLVGGVGALLVGIALCRYATFLTVSENLAFYYSPDFTETPPDSPITVSFGGRLATIRQEAIGRSFFQDIRRASTLKDEDGKLRRSFDESESETIRYLRTNSNSASDLLEDYSYSSIWDLLVHLTILGRSNDEFNVITAWGASGVGLKWHPGCDPSADCSEHQVSLSGYLDYLQKHFVDHLDGMVTNYRCDDAAVLATALTKRLIVMRSPRGPELQLETRVQKSKMLLEGIFLSNPAVCQQDNAAARLVLTTITADAAEASPERLPDSAEHDLVVPMSRYLKYLALLRDHRFPEAAGMLASIESGPRNALFSELIVLQMARVIFWNWQVSGERSAPIALPVRSNFFRIHPTLPAARWSTSIVRKGRPSSLSQLMELSVLLTVPSFKDDVAQYIQIMKEAIR